MSAATRMTTTGQNHFRFQICFMMQKATKVDRGMIHRAPMVSRACDSLATFGMTNDQ
jgi:hypothetical protein